MRWFYEEKKYFIENQNYEMEPPELDEFVGYLQERLINSAKLVTKRLNHLSNQQ